MYVRILCKYVAIRILHKFAVMVILKQYGKQCYVNESCGLQCFDICMYFNFSCGMHIF